jgi:D-glycero-alpha-D-manno-heptose-7-phosphate kinase
MIIVQTPLRVSFFGGGTDFPAFFLQEGGCVLSSAIDKYIFVIIKKRFDQKLRVGYTRTEIVDDVSGIQHDLIREAFRLTGVSQGVEITTMGDIPAQGSGLGSSSTVTVGALHAMYTLQGKIVTAEFLARQACEIEIIKLGKPIGYQDQYIAAFGGFRFLEFDPCGEIRVEGFELDPCTSRKLRNSFMLFYTGSTRNAESVLDEQKNNIEQRLDILREIKNITYTARDELKAGNLESIGALLHKSWKLKKSLASKISNSYIDSIYDSALKAGATGGKITGAGGGGFLLLYCAPEKQESVRSALNQLQELPFQLEPDGTKVIFNHQR